VLAQVDLVLEKLKEDRKIAAATHNITAYRSAKQQLQNTEEL